MPLSVFDIFKVGIGPSSSHTFGPMVAAKRFIEELKEKNLIQKIEFIKIDLYGSLALTGDGHGTFLAIELGLEGYGPETINPRESDNIVTGIFVEKELNLAQLKKIKYEREKDLILHKTRELPFHSNAFTLTVLNENKEILYSNTYYSIGGGFVLDQEEAEHPCEKKEEVKLKYEFCNFRELMKICDENDKTIAQVVMENELCFRTEAQINERLQYIVEVMGETIKNGLARTGKLTGRLRLERRSPALYEKLSKEGNSNPLNIFEWVSVWALAAAEENASFGRVVTAPTNGACSVIPAVIEYVKVYQPEKYKLENLRDFVLVAGIIGILFKQNATISGAEGGCQAEMGTACSMAAGGLAALNGGTNLQCENAAVIGIVHNLGLTCDPIAGLVQIPCMERNSINAVKAITAERIAMREQKSLYITLDQAILTMKQAGKDMHSKYKETAQGGLAINSKDGRETLCAGCFDCTGNCY